MVNVALLLTFILYSVPALLAIRALFIIITAANRRRRRTGFVQLALWTAAGLLLWLRIAQVRRQEELAQLGRYFLTAYPQCPRCALELQANNRFVVTDGRQVREIGTWRYESGQDYWITYLNDHDQLGSGRYAYTRYQLRHPR